MNKGFFIMVECGKIDWMCHANDAATVMAEVADFDNAVKVALEFARKNPRDTLVVVTGDHETGGLTMGFAGTAYNSYIDRLNAQKCSREAFNSASKRLAGGGKDIKFEDVMPLLSESFGFVFDENSKSPFVLPRRSAGSSKRLSGGGRRTRRRARFRSPRRRFSTIRRGSRGRAKRTRRFRSRLPRRAPARRFSRAQSTTRTSREY